MSLAAPFVQGFCFQGLAYRTLYPSLGLTAKDTIGDQPSEQGESTYMWRSESGLHATL